jgi:hypothetical protein
MSVGGISLSSSLHGRLGDGRRGDAALPYAPERQKPTPAQVWSRGRGAASTQSRDRAHAAAAAREPSAPRCPAQQLTLPRFVQVLGMASLFDGDHPAQWQDSAYPQVGEPGHSRTRA